MQNKLRPVIGEPILIPSYKKVVFPFAAEGDETEKLVMGISSGSYLALGSAASGIGSFGNHGGSSALRWNNVILFDPASGAAQLLFDKPTMICHFYFPDPERGPVFGAYLLFGVARQDTNRDGMINADDAVVLMASDLAGSPPRPLSPADGQLVEVTAHKDDPAWLYFSVRLDSDADGRFTPRDRTDPFRVQPAAAIRDGASAPAERIPVDKLRDDAMKIVLEAARQPKE